MKNIIKLSVAGTEYKLPANLNEIPYSLGKEVYRVVEADYVNEADRVSRLLTLLAGSNDEIVVTDADLKLVSSTVQTILNKGLELLPQVIKYGGSYYAAKPLEQITVEDFIKLEFIFKGCKSVMDYGPQLLSWLYYKVPTKFMYRLCTFKSHRVRGVLTVGTKQQKLDTTKALGDIASEISTALAIAVTSYLVEFRDTLAKTYTLLYSKEEPTEESAASAGRRKVKGKYARTSRVASVSETYGLYDTLYTVCNNSQLEVDNWLGKTVEEFFTFLEYRIQKNKEELVKLKQENNGK